MPLAVSNSSPLIHLAAIKRLELLRRFHDEVLIPPAVWREVVEEGEGRPGAGDVADAANRGWIRVVAPADATLIRLLQRELHLGEAEAIALAVEHAPDVLLLDESEARRVADTFRLHKAGTIGVLIRAKHDGIISSLGAELARLRDEASFWINETVYRRAMASVGEATDSAATQ